MPPWEKRRVGRTSLEVTSLGLGTATMGGSRIPITDAQGRGPGARRLGVRRALRRHRAILRRRRGGAPGGRCAADRAARRMGAVHQGGPAAAARRHAAVDDGRLAPMPFHVVYDYSYDGIMRSVEDSYQRLGLPRIDILYVHDIGDYQHGPEANAHHLQGAARQRLQGAGPVAPQRHGARDRHRREREGGADRGAEVRRLGRVPAGRPLHAAGAGAARRPAADVQRARHLDRGGRAVELRHPGRA